MAKRSLIRRGLKLGLFLLALLLAYLFVDFSQLWASLSSLSFPLFLGMIALATLDRLAMSYKWHHLAQGLDIHLPFRECVKAYYAGSIVNYLVPTSLSGDAVRGYWLARVSERSKEVFASLLMEKAIGLISAIVLCWVGLAFYATQWESPLEQSFGLALLLISIGAAAALALSLSRRLHARIVRLLGLFHLNPFVSTVEKVYASYLKFRNTKERLVWNFVLALLENLIQFFIAYLAALGLGIGIGLVPFLALMALVTFVRRLIAYLDSWGFSESVVVAMFALAGISPSLGLALVLARHGAIILASLPGLLLLPGVSEVRSVSPSQN